MGARGLAAVALWFASVGSSFASPVTVSGKVVDENGVAVAGARVELVAASPLIPVTAISDNGGRFDANVDRPGGYQVRAQREGFFVLIEKTVQLHEGQNELTLTLHHLREFTESIEVNYSPPAIDLREPAERQQLNSIEILEIPYPASQDIRSAMPLMQGVVQDTGGRLHFNGGATAQTNFNLDGFNISDPVTGRFEARLNIESVRTLELESSRFSAEKGKGSAGSVDIKTEMGDDRWRFSGANFIPGVSYDSGLLINKWTPRARVSGPVKKGRAWFHNGFDSFYDVNVIHGLPHGQDRSRALSGSNLSRFQVNLAPGNILTGSFLINHGDDFRHGLTFLDPIETTTNRRQNLYMSTIKDQIYLHGGAVLEGGFADSRGLLRDSPQGNRIFSISPSGRSGNYFVDLTRHIYRQQWLANLFLPPMALRGSHQFKFGTAMERESFDRTADRHDYQVLRADHTLARQVHFAGNSWQARRNFSVSQYAQDRWAPREGLLIEVGLRADWEQVVRDMSFSPRISAVYAPKWLHDTKLAAGFGIFHDALSLGPLAQHQDQISLSTFFPLNGLLQRGPVATAFLVNDRELRAPRYRNLSFTVERKLPFDLYAKAGYMHKAGSRGLTFINQLEAFGNGGLYQLRNWRRDHYDAAEFTLRRTFAGKFEWSAGYTRSSARSNAVVDYSLENPIFGPQGPGPLAWDTPNRFMTWGWAPFPKGGLPALMRRFVGETDIAYLAEYRTGFPFGIVNEEAVQVGNPNSRRFPAYFDINLSFERKFRALHYLWAWRFGINNITNNGNPNVVNNNTDSPAFLTYGRGQKRAFAVRLRFIGKK